MFGSKKNGRQEIFKKAMLSRGKRAAPRRSPIEVGKNNYFWPSFFLWSAFVIVSGYILLFSPGLSVSLVSVKGDSILPLEDYEQYVQQSIEGRYFGFIPKNNFFLIPVKNIERGIARQYPKISHVRVERQFPIGIRVAIEESPLLFRWCSGGPCYGFREGALHFLPAVEDSRYEPARLSIIDDSARPVIINDRFDVDAYFQVFDFFYQKTSQQIGTAIRREAHTPSRYSQELLFETEEGWSIQLSTEREPESSLRALQVFLEDYARVHSDRQQLSRVDLRVEGKIFFSDQSQLSPSGDAEAKSDK